MSRTTALRLAPPVLALVLLPAVGVTVLALTNGRVEAATDYWRSPLLAEPPAGPREPFALRVVTFNIADAYLFTSNRRERMRGIADVLRELDPDLVGLQEAFIESDRALLLRELAGTRLRHHVRFPSATVGNGLWILSAHRIAESWFHRFEHSNPWWKLSDWWAGKGVGLARIELPGGGVLDFFDTHAQAGRGNPENDSVRLAQMGELARFLRKARAPGAPALIVGDFNTRPGAPDYERAVREAGLLRMMSRPSQLDHVFAIADPRYGYREVDTVEIRGRVQGSEPALLVGRAPYLSELFRTWLGGPEPTPLSDHPGYLVSLRVEPGGVDPAATGDRARTRAARGGSPR